MFKKIMILSFIFVVGSCQTKSEKREDKKNKRTDTKLNTGGLPGELQSEILSYKSCKKNISICRDCISRKIF